MEEKSLTYRMLTGKVELLPDVIRYKRRSYPYSTVVHLGRFAIRSYLNFIPLGYYLRIRIYIESIKKPITLHNSVGLIGTTSRLREIYEMLVEKTFQTRIKNYLEKINSRGYFEYGGAVFYPSGEVTINNKRLNLHTAKLCSEPFKFILKEPKGFLGRKHRISTDVDQDVFLALLKEIYGISFG